MCCRGKDACRWGQIGGDNTLYTYDLTKNNWMTEEQQFGGLYKEVQENINTLYTQTINFKVPSYQKKGDNKFTLLGASESSMDNKVAKLKGGDIQFLSGGGNFSENTSRDDLVAVIGKDALKVDKRRKYDNTREEIIEWARQKEAAGEKFEMWVGHGTDPFFVRLETIEEMVKVAPNTCCGLVYAEMDNTADPRVQYFVDVYMPRLAKAIRDNKAQTKLYFRYKNMFWAADSHEPLWKKLFFSKEYKDIVIPSAEDTNNRLQDINLAGRVGMFMSGSIDNFAMRMVDDNPTSWRPYSPGGQRSVSPYLRASALLAAYGSRHGLFFPIKYLETPGYNAFYALIKSGVIPTVKPEDILSVGSFMLVNHVSEEYLSKVNNGHDLIRYSTEDGDGVISYAGVHWCGVDVPDYDYSKIASGVDYRWLNFMPPMPNGMVPITESEFAPELKKKGVGYVETDIYQGIVNGKKVDAKSFGSTLEKSVQDGAKTLLMTVDGASWGLFKIDDKHARLILVDPGFIDPARRDVTINLQNMTPVKAVDILSGESIKVKNNEIKLSVPAGSMRFIDFEYSKNISR